MHFVQNYYLFFIILFTSLSNTAGKPINIKKLNEQLKSAAASGDTSLVIDLVALGADVHYDLEYALNNAARNGHTDTVKALLKLGANIHNFGETPMQQAIWNGHTDTVKALLNNPGDPADIHYYNDLALRRAGSLGHIDIVKLLLKNGADIHANDDEVFRQAIAAGRIDPKTGSLELAQVLLDNDPPANIHAKGEEALIYQAAHGRIVKMKFLLKNGADINADNDAAFRKAARYGKTKMMSLLATYKPKSANIHANKDEAIKVAVKNNNNFVLKELFKLGTFNPDLIQQLLNTKDLKDYTKELLKKYALNQELATYKKNGVGEESLKEALQKNEPYLIEELLKLGNFETALLKNLLNTKDLNPITKTLFEDHILNQELMAYLKLSLGDGSPDAAKNQCNSFMVSQMEVEHLFNVIKQRYDREGNEQSIAEIRDSICTQAYNHSSNKFLSSHLKILKQVNRESFKTLISDTRDKALERMAASGNDNTLGELLSSVFGE